ncbi:tyrosine-type recombinase/integrase [uncultured Vagococcus sp.]|uniref:tyrosine-type recombinase/integrase n=1 Tax=uncultured Vagococcus sp. TaxID=189676 RepID=UPI0028D8D2F7|nr:tyrosine-type recombinase/integrase [uncultured Vagococcus sp.]
MSKREKTKYPNIFKYQTSKGTRYQIRKKTGQISKPEINESGFSTIASAKSKLAETERLLNNNESGLLLGNSVTVNDYYKEYVELKISANIWTPDTASAKISCFKTHILPKFGKTKLVDIDRITYQKWINELLKTFSKSSVQSYHVIFIGLINDAVYTGIIDRNKLQKIVIGNSKIAPRKKDITLSQYREWIKVAEDILDKFSFTMVYLTTLGLRRGEVMGLTSRVINLEESTIKISLTRTLKSPDGKGTKTTSSERTLPVDDKSISLLKYAMKQASERRLKFGEILHQDDFIFTSPVANEPYHVTHLNYQFTKVNRITGMNISPHMMRHNFATQSSMAGIDPLSYSRFLGHASLRTTEGYTHPSIEQGKSVLELFRNQVK